MLNKPSLSGNDRNILHYQIDKDALVSIISNANTRKISDIGLKIIDSIPTINNLLVHKEVFDEAYEAKIEERKK